MTRLAIKWWRGRAAYSEARIWFEITLRGFRFNGSKALCPAVLNGDNRFIESRRSGEISAEPSHLAVEHALLLEAQIFGRVGDDGKGGFGVMPERTKQKLLVT